jgi:GDP/UDP-N,N'-diacetylbacillosamine 2-epimerase (hydrolysing)
MITKKKIAVFTSIRSEYGVLTPLLTKLKNHYLFDFELIVGGAHLSHEYGFTISEIKKDGFKIACEIPFLNSNSICSSLSILQNSIGEYFTNNKIDLLIVVGDRFELIPVVSSALILNIPIAHISGGDITIGAIDNQIRHAVTKMSHIHFPGTEKSKQNIIKMGEESWRVCNVGELGIDSILENEPIEKELIFKELGLQTSKKTAIITFHPETISNGINSDFLIELFQKFQQEFLEFQFIITASNFDLGGEEINTCLRKIAQQNSNMLFVESLGQKRYYSMLRYVDVMIGNSSSGIIETQSFNLPVINVGERQNGREQNINTIDVPVNIEKIIDAFKYALSTKFKNEINNSKNLYGNGDSANQIINYLENCDFNLLLIKKDTF